MNTLSLKKIITLTALTIGIWCGSIVSAQGSTCGSIPTCSDPAEQEAFSYCVNLNQGFEGDLLQMLQGCTTTSCGLHGYHCSQGTQQVALNNCILANQITDTSTIANRCIAPLGLSSCTADPAPCASCGSSNGISTTSIPSPSLEGDTSALCEIGNPSSISTINNTYNRTCTTSNIGNTNSSTCTAYKSVSSNRDGVCGTAQNQQTTSAPTTNLCSEGKPVLSYTIPVIGTPITMYRWSCLPVYAGGRPAQCTSYQTPTQAVESISYSGTILNTKITLPQTRRSVSFQPRSENGTLLSGDQLISQYKNLDLYHNISPNIQLHINIKTSTDQLIQFGEKNINGVDFFGCNASDWNVSITGLVSDYLLYKINNQTSINNTQDNPYTPTSSMEDFVSWQNEKLHWIISGLKRGDWNASTPEGKFLAWDGGLALFGQGFEVTCDLTTTITPPVTQTGTCIGLPANATPNTATTITQYAGSGGWSPSTGYKYDPTPSTTSCNFVCEDNYTRNTTSKTCEPNTQTVACSGVQPANTTANSGTTYTQTRSGTIWTPIVSWTGGTTGVCTYRCATNYTRSGTSQTCIANTQTVACNGVQPLNTTANSGTTYIQTRNGTIWTPTISWTLGASTCGYSNTYSRYTGDWGTCAVTSTPIPVTGVVCPIGYTSWGSGGLGYPYLADQDVVDNNNPLGFSAYAPPLIANGNNTCPMNLSTRMGSICLPTCVRNLECIERNICKDNGATTVSGYNALLGTCPNPVYDANVCKTKKVCTINSVATSENPISCQFRWGIGVPANPPQLPTNKTITDGTCTDITDNNWDYGPSYTNLGDRSVIAIGASCITSNNITPSNGDLYICIEGSNKANWQLSSANSCTTTETWTYPQNDPNFIYGLFVAPRLSRCVPSGRIPSPCTCVQAGQAMC